MKKDIWVTKATLPPYEEYIDAIKPLWESHFITNMGKYHGQLENELKSYLDVQEVSLLVNGHMALEMTIQSFEFPVGSEVITTPFTFISTTHAIIRNQLVPVFCDVKKDGTIDEDKIESLITDKTVAILPVHVYGNICNVEAIQKIANRRNLKVIYDAAHAFGEKYKGCGVGNFGDASVFSFHATKVFNTIEGGAVTFSNRDLYEKLYSLKNFGIRGEEIVESVGANAKMNEFCAVMGLCNIKHIDETIESRRRIWAYYKDKLSKIEGIEFLEEKDCIERNYSYFPILVSSNYKMSRDELYLYLAENRIHARKYFYPLTSSHDCCVRCSKVDNIDVAKDLSERVLTLPMYPELSHKEVEEIVELF